MIINYNNPGCIQILADILVHRGVAIVKSDTIYGLTGIAPDTGDRISRIKHKDPGKPMVQLIPDKSWLAKYSGIILPPALSELWPGALTIIIPLKESGSAGLRVPDDSFLRKLLYRIGSPLFSTSVNREGNEPLWKINDIIAEFENEVDLIVDSGDVAENIPSTVLDITSTPFRIQRQGKVIIPPGLLT
ncbi:MAG: L-threonylcarbamoyladenylate synthase [Spirochaetales bacterium]|nr:L-threonylcarbamoyladenylate synthase [Spirochaetales bacterium]